MKKITAYLIASVLATLTAIPAGGQTLADGDWSNKQRLVIDSTATGADLKEGTGPIPLAVRLHTGNFAFASAKPDGADLRFAATDGRTPLKFHIERYDAASELAVLWVQVPKLPANVDTDSIVLLSGNPKASAVSDPKGTYDAAQTLVLHFDEKKLPQDATGNGNNARESNAIPGAAGPLAGGATFNGNARILVPASDSLRVTPSAGFTFTAWVKPTDIQRGVFYEQGGAKGLAVGMSNGALTVAIGGREFRAGASLKPGIWQHVAVTAAGGKVAFYINGAPAGGASAPLNEVSGDVIIGARYSGDLDEVTLASAARAPDYIKALYASQQPDGALLNFAEVEEDAGESSSYIGILLGALTVDGWIIIAILAVMFFISVAVMIGKTRFLLRARGANDLFLDRFRDQSEDVLAPGSPEALGLLNDPEVRHSPIHRLYVIGLRELEHRFDTQTRNGERIGISAAALNSIRASMDAGMVRESQRLNSQIVLLTIAISGGPFLGLLGTVVGVMITFAAIAAAGDVNVNSIAPGIAAALVATVAGLAVAIPALFGYNWLAIQIRNASADTQVFADEFLTKAAELYAP